MGHEKRILEAFDANGIERILIIDDAFDAPPLATGGLGPLLDFLEGAEGQAKCAELDITQEQIDAAIQAANEDLADDDTIVAINAALFNAYLGGGGPEVDPGERFKTLKGPMLDVLAPLQSLLAKCDKAELEVAGLVDALGRYRDKKPNVVFLDFFLGPDVPATVGGTPAAKSRAKRASIDLLGSLLSQKDIDPPAVVLMSSRDVKDQANAFRQAVNPGADRQVMALRFRFIEKNWLKQGDGGILTIEHDAADALLDTSQGYEFGTVLQQALLKWRKGATDALDSFLTEIGGLEPKDFAYLFRFRLLSEGERMGDYLEWMFGEGLKTLIDETINWKDDAFTRLDDPKLSESIEGAFDGPSLRIAQIFDRIRVNRHATRPSPRYQIGDVYVTNDKDQARVVITPDCDLVPRKGGPNAKSLLTMSGKLRSFDQDSTSADHFVLMERKPRSVKWDTKDLRSIPFEGDGSLKDEKSYSYYGTLRPIYAQEVQRHAITDLSRIGLAVSPSMGVDASLVAYIRVKDGGGTKYSNLNIAKSPIATILLARGDGKDGHKVLFRRPFIHALLDALRAVDQTTLQADDKDALVKFLKDQSEGVLVKALLTRGSTASRTTSGPLGIRLAIGTEPHLGKNNSWLHVMLDLSEESMQELLTVDPTLLSEPTQTLNEPPEEASATN